MLAKRGIRVSPYPRNAPSPTVMKSTAGAARARMRRYDIACVCSFEEAGMPIHASEKFDETTNRVATTIPIMVEN